MKGIGRVVTVLASGAAMRAGLAMALACAGTLVAGPLAYAAPPAAADTAAGAAVDAASCQALARLHSPDAAIASAQIVAAGPAPRSRAAGPPIQLPAHCLVKGALDERTGADGRHYQIGFELRLPAQWNGRFLYQGGGGTDGIVLPAIGSVGVSSQPALARGFAVASSDGGHQGLDASFGFDQQARLDFAYASIGTVTPEAKYLIEQLYGRGPRYSYFAGCSNGGREAMMAAERYPDQFDGVVAGDPGFHLTAAALAEIWDLAQFDKVAPRDAQGHPILSAAFSDTELKLLSAAVLRQCDALDGLADGMINDVRGCHFDPAVLQCKSGAGQDCLSAAKVATLRAVFGGAHDSAGHRLGPDWPYDAGIDGANWRAWKLGTSPSAAANAINATLGLNSFRDYFLTPPQPTMTVESFDFDRDPRHLAQTAAIDDAVSTFMTTFAARKGRLLIYQGMSDPVFSANDIIHWYEQLGHDSGDPQSWARLFLVPGMNHCAGGPATDQFDALTAIVDWTERGIAPQHLLARSASMPGVSRPLCPYPKYAHYTGGDKNAAASFECR